jgi:hypothetical protein
MATASHVKVKNTTGKTATDLHITFRGTGGKLQIDPSSVKPKDGRNAPKVPSNGDDWPERNEGAIEWDHTEIGKDEEVEFDVAVDFGEIQFASGYWTGGADHKENIGPVKKEDVEITPKGKTDADTGIGEALKNRRTQRQLVLDELVVRRLIIREIIIEKITMIPVEEVGVDLFAHPQIIVPDGMVICEASDDCVRPVLTTLPGNPDTIKCGPAVRCRAGGCRCHLFRKKKEPGIAPKDRKEDWKWLADENTPKNPDSDSYDYGCLCLK